ncbi:MAG: hypothetical protein ACR2MF_02615 [Chthoniobacterales bacterium]
MDSTHTQKIRPSHASYSYDVAIFSILACVFILGCDRPATDSTTPSAASDLADLSPAPADESAGAASILANPNPVPAGEGPGKTTITWRTSDDTDGEIYVTINGAEEKLFAKGLQGTSDAPWISPDCNYEFRLYSGTDHKTVLARVIVTRAKN